MERWKTCRLRMLEGGRGKAGRPWPERTGLNAMAVGKGSERFKGVRTAVSDSGIIFPDTSLALAYLPSSTWSLSKNSFPF